MIQKIEKLDDTHLLKHIKQATLVWSFRQNTFLGSLQQKCSIWSCFVAKTVNPPVPSRGLLNDSTTYLINRLQH